MKKKQKNSVLLTGGIGGFSGEADKTTGTAGT